MRAGIAFALVTFVLFAGCSRPQDAPSSGVAVPSVVAEPPAAQTPTEAPPPEPDEEMPSRVVRVVPLEARASDGTALRGHVYLPDAREPFATILGVGPYWGNEFPATDDMLQDGALRAIYGDETYAGLARAGFAVAFFNVRGTGASDGCYRFFDPRDGPDAASIVEALAAQPWSDGSVGMYGVSYDGWTQYAAMAQRPPHLLATAPISGILDLWSVSTRHGAMVRIYAGAGAAYTWGSALDGSSATSGAGEAGAPSPAAAHLCAEGARETASIDAVAADGDKSEAFRARDLRLAVRASGIPAFATYGLAQPDLGPDGRLTPGEGLVMNAENLSDILPGGSRIVVGPWPHGPPPYDAFPDEIVAWFDARLRDGPLRGPPVRYQDELGWHEAERWPPPGSAVSMPLDAGGRFVSSERAPALSSCGPDQAMYVSPALERDTRLAGSFRLEVEATATGRDGNVAAWLFAFHGDDPCDASDVRDLARAHTDLRHRGSLERGVDVPVGSPIGIDVTSAPFSASVRAGDRLALVVAGGDWLTLQPKPAAPLVVLGEGTLTLPVVACPSADVGDGLAFVRCQALHPTRFSRGA